MFFFLVWRSFFLENTSKAEARILKRRYTKWAELLHCYTISKLLILTHHDFVDRAALTITTQSQLFFISLSFLLFTSWRQQLQLLTSSHLSLGFTFVASFPSFLNFPDLCSVLQLFSFIFSRFYLHFELGYICFRYVGASRSSIASRLNRSDMLSLRKRYVTNVAPADRVFSVQKLPPYFWVAPLFLRSWVSPACAMRASKT